MKNKKNRLMVSRHSVSNAADLVSASPPQVRYNSVVESGARSVGG